MLAGLDVDRARLRDRVRLGLARSTRRSSGRASTTPRSSSRRPAASRRSSGSRFRSSTATPSPCPSPTRASTSPSPSTAPRSGPIPYRWVPEAARLLRPGGRLAFLVNGTFQILTIPDYEADGPSGDRLLRPYFGMHRFEWPDDDSVEFHLGYGDWIRLLRANGFEVEDLIEVQPAPGATTNWTWSPRNGRSAGRSRRSGRRGRERRRRRSAGGPRRPRLSRDAARRFRRAILAGAASSPRASRRFAAAPMPPQHEAVRGFPKASASTADARGDWDGP